MKNITLSAEEEAIEEARKVAAQKHRTLNDLFREWLDALGKSRVEDTTVEDNLNSLWKRTSYLRIGKKLTHDEMNERYL